MYNIVLMQWQYSSENNTESGQTADYVVGLPGAGATGYMLKSAKGDGLV